MERFKMKIVPTEKVYCSLLINGTNVCYTIDETEQWVDPMTVQIVNRPKAKK